MRARPAVPQRAPGPEEEPDPELGLTAAGLLDLLASLLFFVSCGLLVELPMEVREPGLPGLLVLQAPRAKTTRVRAISLVMVLWRTAAAAPAVWRRHGSPPPHLGRVVLMGRSVCIAQAGKPQPGVAVRAVLPPAAR